MHIHICGINGIEIAEMEVGPEHDIKAVCTLKFTGCGGPQDAVTIGEFSKEELGRFLGEALAAVSDHIMEDERDVQG